MNDKTVGMENLPNVFIHKILLNQIPNGYKIKIALKMFDSDEQPSWKNKISDLKVKVCIFDDTDEIQKLNSGLSSLHDYTFKGRPQIIPSAAFMKRSSSEGYSMYAASVEQTLPFRPLNLNVYCACFIDDLGFNIPMFDKFYGPMAGEKVLVNGVVNEQTSYFYYPDTNEEYAGPVHQKPDGSYMEGSKHTKQPHKNVVQVMESNYKIVYND